MFLHRIHIVHLINEIVGLVRNINMAPATKVSINQWLLTGVVGLISIVSAFRLVQYKVQENATSIKEANRCMLAIQTETKNEKSAVWSRFDSDREDRQEIEKNMADIEYNIKSLETQMNTNYNSLSKDQLNMQKTLNAVLVEVKKN